jgi:hypothetical protein
MSQQAEHGYGKNCEPPRMENDGEKNEKKGEYDPLPVSIFHHLRHPFCKILLCHPRLWLKLKVSYYPLKDPASQPRLAGNSTPARSQERASPAAQDYK